MKKFMPWSIPAVTLGLVINACTPATTPATGPKLPMLDRHLLKIQFKYNDRIMVPTENVTKRGGVTGVFVLQDQQARFRMVRTGKENTRHIEILSGLHGSEILVGGDLNAVYDGSPLNKH